MGPQVIPFTNVCIIALLQHNYLINRCPLLRTISISCSQTWHPEQVSTVGPVLGYILLQGHNQKGDWWDMFTSCWVSEGGPLALAACWRREGQHPAAAVLGRIQGFVCNTLLERGTKPTGLPQVSESLASSLLLWVMLEMREVLCKLPHIAAE